MPYRFGDVIVVPFPFTDQSTTKKRPAIVVSSDAYNRSRPDIILTAVTSQVRPTLGVGEFLVAHWQDAGLLKPSVLKPIFTTIEARLVLHNLGRLHADDMAALRGTIAAVLG